MNNIILKGGLGNQLFQLSMYLFLKKDKNFKFFTIDTVTGFLFDFQYRRKLEIQEIRRNNFFRTIFISIINVIFIFFDKYFPFINKLLKIKIVNDKNFKKVNFGKKNFFILNGYFQDFEILRPNLGYLYNFIKPNFEKRYSKKFEQLYKKIKSTKNSVAICIRFYEEAKNPLSHIYPNTKFKSYSEFNKLINKFEKDLNKPEFYIFVQNENEFTHKLLINSPHFIISHNNGYEGSWARLKAQALCKHHIFNNSTFYYWGATFSKFLNKDDDVNPKIYVANNFIFKDIYNPKWEKF